MNARKYLKQLQYTDMKIRQKKAELDQLKSSTMSVGSISNDPNKVQTSKSYDPIGDSVARYADLESEIRNLIFCYVSEQNRITNMIHSLPNKKQAEVLMLHYVPDVKTHEVKTLNEIADIMMTDNGRFYSYDHIRRLHGRAINSFQTLLDNRKYKNAL